MLYSTVTAKGQTTIPKEVRDYLGLSPNDRIVYCFDSVKKRVILTPVQGTILGLKGIVPHNEGEIDFKELREKMKKAVVKHNAKESQ